MKLAYTISDAPGQMNATLRGLADRLSAEGLRAVGAVQVNTDAAPDEPAAMDLVLLPDGPTVGISQRLGAGSSGCRLDPDALERAVQQTAERLAAGADVLIVNKFGAHEVDGRGFRELIGTALESGTPAIVGVTTAKLPAFRDFVGDLAVAVPCDADTLHDWLFAPNEI